MPNGEGTISSIAAHSPTFDGFMDLKFFLEDLLGRKVDLVTDQALKPRIRVEVEKEAVYAARF